MQPEAKQSAYKALGKATECFQNCLKGTPSNVFAAQGIGAILAEQGHMQAAHTIFTQVNGWLPCMPFVSDAMLPAISGCNS